MSVKRFIRLVCNSDDCENHFISDEDTWVDGPARSDAGRQGWKYVGHKDICPDCVAATLALNACPIPGSKK